MNIFINYTSVIIHSNNKKIEMRVLDFVERSDSDCQNLDWRGPTKVHDSPLKRPSDAVVYSVFNYIGRSLVPLTLTGMMS